LLNPVNVLLQGGNWRTTFLAIHSPSIVNTTTKYGQPEGQTIHFAAGGILRQNAPPDGQTLLRKGRPVVTHHAGGIETVNLPGLGNPPV
jgi:hypothetical protein